MRNRGASTQLLTSSKKCFSHLQVKRNKESSKGRKGFNSRFKIKANLKNRIVAELARLQKLSRRLWFQITIKLFQTRGVNLSLRVN